MKAVIFRPGTVHRRVGHKHLHSGGGAVLFKTRRAANAGRKARADSLQIVRNQIAAVAARAKPQKRHSRPARTQGAHQFPKFGIVRPIHDFPPAPPAAVFFDKPQSRSPPRRVRAVSRARQPAVCGCFSAAKHTSPTPAPPRPPPRQSAPRRPCRPPDGRLQFPETLLQTSANPGS